MPADDKNGITVWKLWRRTLLWHQRWCIAYINNILWASTMNWNWCSFFQFNRSFRNIFEHIQNELKKKFPNDETAPYTGPSGFIFLRFFCPALLNLKAFGLVNGTWLIGLIRLLLTCRSHRPPTRVDFTWNDADHEDTAKLGQLVQLWCERAVHARDEPVHSRQH